MVEDLGWTGPVFRMSGLASEGTKLLCAAIMDYIDEGRQQELAEPELLERAEQRRMQIQTEAREQIDGLSQLRRHARQQQFDVEGDDDDHDVEVVYAE